MVVKTGIAFPDETYRKLEEISREAGYTSISRAVRDAVELFIAFNNWWRARGHVAGTITILAPPRSGRAHETLRTLEAEYKDIIISTTRIVLPEDYTLYTLAIHGPGSRVRSLYKMLTGIRGLAAVQPSLLAIPEPRGREANPPENASGSH